jgi:Bacterial PH domain
MVRTEREMIGVYGPVIFTIQPSSRGFIYRYLLGFTPVVLVALSLIILTLLQDAVKGFPSPLVSSLQTIVPDLPQYLEICIFLITPVAVLLFFIWLGDTVHSPEIWVGAGLTLLLSGIGAVVMVQSSDLPLLSTFYLLALFQWIAYLVQPSCVVAAMVVIAGTELFRRTLHYTLTRDVVIITGGIGSPVENVIPLHQIEKVGLIQTKLGHRFHFGTIVLAGKVFGLSEIDMTGHHQQGDILHPYTDQVSTMNWKRGSHDPLVCLYGILQPEEAKAQIEKAMQRQSNNT